MAASSFPLTFLLNCLMATFVPTRRVASLAGTMAPVVSPQTTTTSSLRSSEAGSCPCRPATISCNVVRLRRMSQVSAVSVVPSMATCAAVPSPGIAPGSDATTPAPVSRHIVPVTNDLARSCGDLPGCFCLSSAIALSMLRGLGKIMSALNTLVSVEFSVTAQLPCRRRVRTLPRGNVSGRTRSRQGTKIGRQTGSLDSSLEGASNQCPDGAEPPPPAAARRAPRRSDRIVTGRRLRSRSARRSLSVPSRASRGPRRHRTRSRRRSICGSRSGSSSGRRSFPPSTST